uniref:NADH-ubiquinone oxidoreductase chain 1 n=1 Tax=Proterops sp. QL-2014 TaxID=1491724 RepID=A0A0U1WEQ5_9HYME|nr:NADH dehydrogenase subunit 1 [Proterops sp. QL-2014]
MLQMLIYYYNSLIMLVLVIIIMLISVAFLTLYERKIMSIFHYRKGPNKLKLIGMMQPFSDAMKLLSKEFFYPLSSNLYMYMISPMIMFILISMLWLIYPFYVNMINFNFSILFFFVIISTGVYGLIFSGWSSNSFFSMLGSVRSIAQSISYEIIFSISFIIIFNMINSTNLFYLIFFNKYIMLNLLFYMIMMMIFVGMLAEINRTPFDLSESESELVSGFNVEYSSSKFVLIFLAEYSSLMFMMFIFSYVFFYMNLMNLFMYMFIVFMIFFITWIRISLPRIRYDKLMFFCWVYLLPMILILFIYFLFLKYLFDFTFML